MDVELCDINKEAVWL